MSNTSTSEYFSWPCGYSYDGHSWQCSYAELSGPTLSQAAGVLPASHLQRKPGDTRTGHWSPRIGTVNHRCLRYVHYRPEGRSRSRGNGGIAEYLQRRMQMPSPRPPHRHPAVAVRAVPASLAAPTAGAYQQT
jgi:hypothetical protein